jgi:hypothetical protein
VAAVIFFALTITPPTRAAPATPDLACLAGIDLAQVRLTEFNQLYEQCRLAGIPLDYPTVAKTVLEQFIPLARQDAEGADAKRAGFAVKDFQRTLDKSIAEMKAYLQQPSLAPNARRFQTGRVEVRGLSFIANRTDAHGHRDRGPVFFCGYGHFDQVRKDMPRWPGYGVNVIQMEGAVLSR